jgi:hypothetical protein
VVPSEYKDWKVYLYEPGGGTAFCPHCKDPVRRGPRGLLPPFVCERDKIFFDACLDPAEWKSKASLFGGYRAGDPASFFMKYRVIPMLK